MENQKKVDEGWKEKADQEKEQLKNVVEESSKEDNASSDPAAATSQETMPEENVNPSPAAEEDASSAQETIEVNFLNYVTSLGFQSLIFLGEIPNPLTNEIQKNLPQAKFLIDTLILLRDKTKGNLTPEEENLLNASIYELEMKYVSILQQEKKA